MSPRRAATEPAGTVELAPRFPVLDTVRAIGAIAVLTTHTAFWSGSYTENGLWGALLARMDVGVAIFFVLSGFLLSRPHLARTAAGAPRLDVRRYYWNRLVRVYPVYAVTAVLALALVPENEGRDVAGWVTTLTLTDVYVHEQLPHGLTQMWSLAVEVSFYAVLPWLMFALVPSGRLRQLRLWTLLAAMVALTCAWHLSLAGAADRALGGNPTTWLPAYLAWFGCGIALAWAHVTLQAHPRARGGRWPAALGAMPGACWALTAALMLVASTPLAGPSLLVPGTPAESLTKALLYTAVGGLVVLTGAFAAPTGRYARMMAMPLPRHLGHISYSTFCIHLPVLHLVMATTGLPLFQGHGARIWVLTLILSLAASEILYRLVELPALRLKRLGGDQPPSASHPTHATTTTSTR